MKRDVPGLSGSDHGVEGGQQLAHAGDQGDLGQLAGVDQPRVEGSDDGVAAGGRECGHVQHTSYVEASALNAPSPFAGAGVVGHGGDAHQGGDLAPVEPAELGQFGDQRAAGHRTDAAGRLQQPIELIEVLAHVSEHLGLDVVELGLDGLDARMQAPGCDPQPLAFADEHDQQLAPARDQRGQPLLLRVGQRAQEPGKVLAAQQHRGELRQHARIGRVGLGQSAHGPGEVACLARVDHRHRQAGGLQRAGQLGFEAAGGLHHHHHQRHAQRLQGRRQCRVSLSLVVKPLGIEPGAQHRNIDVRLGNVDTIPTTTEEADMVFGSLACACALGQAGARNRSDFRKTSTATVRSLLRNGLRSPSAYQAAQTGLAAPSAIRLYRAGLV